LEFLVLKSNVVTALLLLLLGSNAHAQEFRILAWNVESNRPNQPAVSDPATIGSQLKELCRSPDTRPTIVALSEVEPKTFDGFRASVAEGIGSDVDHVTSASGGFMDSDSLMLIADKNRFEILDSIELHRYAGIAANFNISDANDAELGALRARSPLAVKLLDKSRSERFWVIVNHLARGEADLRTDQAKMLCKWAEDHPEPIIAVGDFNFDYDFHTQAGNDGFKAMMAGEVWTWLKPDPLVDSNWSDDRRVRDRRVDRYPDSILDFAFVANSAKKWNGKSSVVVRDGDFPDDEKTSDHRPLISKFTP
jgi:endonuclease/exonuclease/phosphatase family metal-dependent hydrolase